MVLYSFYTYKDVICLVSQSNLMFKVDFLYLRLHYSNISHEYLKNFPISKVINMDILT